MIQSRIFVVGCPRSGTTLLQSLIGAHPSVFAFPETHFLFPIIRKWGFTLPFVRSRRHLKSFVQLEQVGIDPKVAKWMSVKDYVQAFIQAFDEITLQQDRAIWSEKTPRHLLYIDTIERNVAAAKFIHIIRDGRDVVASLFKVTSEHPKEWGGARTLDQCIAMWNGDISLSLRHKVKPNHHYVLYSDLVAKPIDTLSSVCESIRIKYSEKMLANYPMVAERLIGSNESWKIETLSSISPSHSRNFLTYLTQDQQDYVCRRLKNHDTSSLT